MSILDFAKNLGRQVFDRDDVAADKIKETMEINLSPIKDLSVEFDDGVVTLCGECMSPADRERAVLVAGNIEGVEKVVATELTSRAPKTEEPEPEPEGEIYEIQSGDTLSGISKRYYGDAMQYMKIFEANKGVIEDPNKIYPGQKIRIPAA
ncbi:MAG: peptidoglycan-binding protein LysM [Gammaproteobacteria bacterium]|nr:peptidoglycan-binding protein LysM [Gammaproteobacteria bacterium]MBT8443585.1 peptidoglycan-binding protein LysM [Gammaproteobacteria bacterium]